MRFVKTEDLKIGMRIARPIYNKNGVLLYDRDSKLTSSSISSVKNFGLIGIFVLDPAEPLPPMTPEDDEFERFQAINVFAIRDELREISAHGKTRRMDFIAEDIAKTFGHLSKKVNFIQNIRSNEDYVYKHSLNVAILAAMLAHRMNAQLSDTSDVIRAAILHDIGKSNVPESLLKDEDQDEQERIFENAQQTGFELIDQVFASNPNIKRICSQSSKLLLDLKYNKQTEPMKIMVGTRILTVADTFDKLTAMSTNGDLEPASYLEALRYLTQHPDVFHVKAVEALVDSIEILGPGTSVELNTGHSALVLATNGGDVLHPVVLDFSTNMMMDLSNKRLYGDIEIVDVVKKMDSRHVIDPQNLAEFGLN